MGIKDILLNKGWAGKTLSREETVERLNPLVRGHCALNRAYDYVIERLEDRRGAEQLAALQKTARMDVGKLSETVLSAGGVASRGADVAPDFDPGRTDESMMQGLLHLERTFEGQLLEERTLDHQVRTRAVLGVVLANSRERLGCVRGLRAAYRRTRFGIAS